MHDIVRVKLLIIIIKQSSFKIRYYCFRELFFQVHIVELKSYAKIHISYTGLQSLERDTMQ